MYAVIQTGGKQYRVQPGDILQVEKLEGAIGSALKFDQVLMVASGDGTGSGITLGKPLLAGANVDCEVVGQGRGDKILIIKMKRRKQYRRTQGHRQDYTQILVTGVAHGSDKATLSAADKTARMATFQTHLKPKGAAFTPAQSTIPKSAEKRAAMKTASAPKKETAAKVAPAKKESAPKAAAKSAAKKPTKKA